MMPLIGYAGICQLDRKRVLMEFKKSLIAVVISFSILCLCATSHANLLVNGSFEDASPTGWPPGFTRVTTTYYAGPAPAGAGGAYGSAWGFHGGWGTMGSSTQTVDVIALVGNSYVFSAWLSSWTADTDYPEVTLEFFSAGGTSLGRVFFDGNNGGSGYIVGSANASGLADPAVAWHQDNWTLYEASGTVPAGAVSAEITLASNSVSNNGNDSYVDLINLDIATGPSVIVTETDGSTSVEEAGSSDNYTLSLSQQPSADVHITATPGDSQIDLGPGPGTAVIVVFTAGRNGDWATPKTIEVTAFDDDVYEGKTPHETIITHVATGGEYQGVDISSVTVDVFDNEETCGDWGYLVTDLNRDCRVNFVDFCIFAEQWLMSVQE
jgi:hypothetical protein